MRDTSWAHPFSNSGWKMGEATIKIVFSGDLGKKDQLIVQDPHEIFNADYLFSGVHIRESYTPEL